MGLNLEKSGRGSSKIARRKWHNMRGPTILLCPGIGARESGGRRRARCVCGGPTLRISLSCSVLIVFENSSLLGKSEVPKPFFFLSTGTTSLYLMQSWYLSFCSDHSSFGGSKVPGLTLEFSCFKAPLHICLPCMRASREVLHRGELSGIVPGGPGHALTLEAEFFRATVCPPSPRPKRRGCLSPTPS